MLASLAQSPDDAFVPLGLHYMRRSYASSPILFLLLTYTGPTCGCQYDAIFLFFFFFAPHSSFLLRVFRIYGWVLRGRKYCWEIAMEEWQ